MSPHESLPLSIDMALNPGLPFRFHLRHPTAACLRVGLDCESTPFAAPSLAALRLAQELAAAQLGFLRVPAQRMRLGEEAHHAAGHFRVHHRQGFGLAVNQQFHYDRYFQIVPSGDDPSREFSRGYVEVAMSMAPRFRK